MTTFSYGTLTFNHKKLEMVTEHHLSDGTIFYLVEFNANTPIHTISAFMRTIVENTSLMKEMGKQLMFFPLRVGQSLKQLTEKFQENCPTLYVPTNKCIGINKKETGYEVKLIDKEDVDQYSFYAFIPEQSDVA